MKRSWASLLPLVLLFTGACQLSPASHVPRRLIIAGGGDLSDSLARSALDFAGGPQVNLVIIPFASARIEAGDEAAAFWRNHGAENVRTLPSPNQEIGIGSTASDDSTIFPPLSLTDTDRQMIESADFIWLGGGDQNRLMTRLSDAGLVDLIRERYRKGTVIGGTSAGAAVMSGRRMTGEADRNVIEPNAAAVAEGLGFFPNTIVDQHFVRRSRFNRLLSQVINDPSCVGIGIDEATAIFVVNDRLDVVGNGQVVVIDGRRAKFHQPSAEQPAAALDVAVHVLRHGMSFNMLPSR